MKLRGVALAALLPALLVSTPARAAATSSPAPGPAILYAPAAVAPQMTNSGVWTAPPILVSGAEAYRQGEFLYQDFLYDDHGAALTTDPQDQRSAGNLFSKPDGTYTYPTDRAYANNAADLVELRVKPLASATAFRLTFNTMKDPTLIAFTIAVGGSDGAARPMPFGANTSSPGDLFLTVHPSGSDLAATLTPAGPAPASVSVDRQRRQVQVLLPHSDFDPAGKVVRLAAATGLWDKANGRYLLPGATQDPNHPGGGAGDPAPSAFFNVAFRLNSQEPMPNPGDVAGGSSTPKWWRDSAQGTALARHDISAFRAFVDFGKLAAGAGDESAVPQTGPFDRILQSHFEPAQGADYSVTCFPQAAASGGGANCPGMYQGNLQPYAVYVPARMPAGGFGMTLLLHSLSATYNQYLSSRNQSQLGNRGSIVITPLGRGPDGFYDGLPGADTFEVWADAAHHYRLNPRWSVISGYSMGGYGTFRLGERFPDLFAKAQSTVGESPDPLEGSLRNVPVLMWNMATDELVPETSYYPTARALDSDGYRYELDVFAPGDHLTLAINDQFAPAAAFLGTTRVDPNPAHVTYVVEPSLDYPQYGFVSDHAYWLSQIRERDRTQKTGTIDVFSHALGSGDPPASPTQFGSGTLTGGNLPALAFARQFKTWGPAPALERQDQLDVNASNVSQVAIDVRRAGVDCRVALNVTSDGPLTVVLLNCNRTLTFS